MSTYVSADRTQPTLGSGREESHATLRQLRHREAELARRLEILNERHAQYPNQVSERRVNELAGKLEEMRARIDRVTGDATGTAVL